MPTAEALWTLPPGHSEIRQETLPNLAANEVQVRTLFTAISRGTESLVYRDQVPVSEHQRMRAPFQQGDFGNALKYGYCNVGQVVDGPASLRHRTVFCLYPHQTQYQVPASAVTVLPQGVPPERAILAANMETAINGLWDAAPRVGDRLTVVGGGVVGALMAWLMGRVPGTDVTLVDVNPQRQTLANALGVGFSLPHQAPGNQDVVVHASGNAEGLNTAVRLAGNEVEIIEMSWYGTPATAVFLGGAFHSKRLTLRASQVGTIAPSRAARKTYADRLQIALSLLTEPTLDCLISGESAFAELPTVLHKLSTQPGDALCHRIRYS
ncbi:MAG: zinc-binding alcohol dehydrogenase [Natronospirillum sp.]